MGNIIEIRKKIEAARSSNKTYLSLSGLDTEDLEELIPDIVTIPGLKTLDLVANENLTHLPESIGQLSNLTHLNIFENHNLTHLPESIGQLSNLTHLLIFENDKFTHLPESIGQLPNLTRLNIFDNRNFTHLPESIGQLSNLLVLDASNCNITHLPETLANLQSIRELNLARNPLSDAARNLLDTNFRDIAIYNMAAADVSYEEVEARAWEKLYTDGTRRKTVIDAVKNCGDLGTVEVEYAGGHKRDKSAEQVINEFVTKFPLNSAYDQDIYGKTARRLIRAVKNQNSSVEERKDKLAQLGVCLGDCGTPVRKYLEHSWVAELLTQSQYEKLSPRDQAIIQRQAVSDAASQLPALRRNELIEQVAGLADAAFAKGARTNPDNPNLRIIGNKEGLPPGTAHSRYAYQQINQNPQLIEQFTSLTCETDDQNLAKRTPDGEYILDGNKIKKITDDYIIGHGFGLPEQQQEQQQREKHINTYFIEMRDFLQQDENQDLYSKYDTSDPTVVKLMDLPAQQAELRKLLEQPAIDVEATYKTFVLKKQSEITNFLEQNNKNIEGRMAQFTTPVNIDRTPRSRSQSPAPAPDTKERNCPTCRIL